MTHAKPDPPPFRVVICDDQDTLRAAILEVLASTPLFQVAGQAATGQECVAEVVRAQPHVLILDVNMPGGGPRVPLEVKEADPELYILVYSGRQDEETEQVMLAAGADQYLTKTGRLAPLLHALTQAIDHRDDTSAAPPQTPRS